MVKDVTEVELTELVVDTGTVAAVEDTETAVVRVALTSRVVIAVEMVPLVAAVEVTAALEAGATVEDPDPPLATIAKHCETSSWSVQPVAALPKGVIDKT